MYTMLKLTHLSSSTLIQIAINEFTCSIGVHNAVSNPGECSTVNVTCVQELSHNKCKQSVKSYKIMF